MDCLTFRRDILATPNSTDRALIEHAADCTACKKYWIEIRHFELSLEAALKISEPECLQPRILLRQSNQGSRITGARRILLAASVFIAVALAIALQSQDQLPAESAVAQYLEDAAFNPPHAASKNEQLHTQVLRDIGVSLSAMDVRVVDVRPCIIAGTKAAHIDVETDHGPVTVLIMPTLTTTHETQLSVADLRGVIAPCPRGSLAVVGKDKQIVTRIRQTFEQAVTFI